MLDRRNFYSIVPQYGNQPAFQIRNRRDEERRRHHGFGRILFIDLAAAWGRFMARRQRCRFRIQPPAPPARENRPRPRS